MNSPKKEEKQQQQQLQLQEQQLQQLQEEEEEGEVLEPCEKHEVLTASPIASRTIDVVESIKELYNLHKSGALSEDEFREAKQRILHMVGGSPPSSLLSISKLSRSTRASRTQHRRRRRSKDSRHSHESRHLSSHDSSRSVSTSSTTSSSEASGFMIAPRAKVWLQLATESDREDTSSLNTKEISSGSTGVLLQVKEQDPPTAGGGAPSPSPGLSRRYGTFQAPWPVPIGGGGSGSGRRMPAALRPSNIVYVEYFNCLGASGNSFEDVQLREDQLRPPYFLHKRTTNQTPADMRGDTGTLSPCTTRTSLPVPRTFTTAASEVDISNIVLEDQRPSVNTNTADSTASTNSNLEMCLNWYWIDMVGRDATRQKYNNALRFLTKQFKISESFLTDRDHSLVLPQISSSPDVPSQFLICLRVATPQIALEDDSVQQLTNRWIIVVDLNQKIVITIHRMDCNCMANMRQQWRSLMEGNVISFQEFLLKIFHDAVNTYESSLDVHADLLDQCESKLFVTQTNMKEHNYDDTDHRGRFANGKILSHFANSSRSPFLLQLLDSKNAKPMDKGAMNMFLYHLHRRTSVQYRVLNVTQTVLAESFTKLRLCSKEHANQMCLHCIELIDRSLGVRDDAKTLLNLHISLQSFRSNELMAVLTKFSVFFTPCSFLAAVYGMNFPYIPEFRWSYGYSFFWLACFLVCILIYLYMGKRGLLH
ncbi:cation transporter [Trypanosoma theileri]|uniref:Cation transporter n=1 Tax=Trypanosoma theileri TaxID=67003 RepID=A0A1X0NVP6_9TRYP|nr:cation transporter [Trypanosoma theileri]ORC88190.1 cation transporter [Trypanosoma theileri]